MAELKRIDTDGVPPAEHASGLGNILREDEPLPFADVEDLLAAAPQSVENYFRVPKVIE